MGVIIPTSSSSPTKGYPPNQETVEREQSASRNSHCALPVFLLFISSHWRGVEGGGSDTLTYWKQGIKGGFDRVTEEGVLDDSLSLILELSHESDTSCKTHHQPVCCSKRRSSSVEAWCWCPINQIPSSQPSKRGNIVPFVC